ncbi:MAG TPA: B12-binding domain-containing radical SAM protein, partial [Lachnospiraceae bacterium]|nr:B12-binding domain-containing radical SAM protein [Lachnospiraceae bacterium]
MRKEGIVLAKNSAEKRENMKVLLVAVNAKYIHSNLAVYYLGKYAAKYKENIKIAEYTINHLPDEILKGIYQ